MWAALRAAYTSRGRWYALPLQLEKRHHLFYYVFMYHVKI
jgi:hypothetical protein